MVPTPRRMTADQRREMLVEAAVAEFGHSGLHGTSTEVIAARAGISHPYLFRLFGTKKNLFLACAADCRSPSRRWKVTMLWLRVLYPLIAGSE